LLSLLKPLLGDNIVLWGASVIERKPGQAHVWHTDIESSAPEGGFVSVWIGIENTSRESSLRLVTRSHLFGKCIQQVVQEKGLRRGEATAEDVLAWARELDMDAELVQPDASNGEAIVFDGRLWHASQNDRTEGRRVALLLQYAAAEKEVRIPDFRQLEWPFRFFGDPRPPVILVSGTSRDGANRIAPPPSDPEYLSILSSVVHPLPMPLTLKEGKRCTTHRVLRGATAALDFVGCHASILSPGH
jgi:hypothetical protein